MYIHVLYIKLLAEYVCTCTCKTNGCICVHADVKVYSTCQKKVSVW